MALRLGTGCLSGAMGAGWTPISRRWALLKMSAYFGDRTKQPEKSMLIQRAVHRSQLLTGVSICAAPMMLSATGAFENAMTERLLSVNQVAEADKFTQIAARLLPAGFEEARQE